MTSAPAAAAAGDGAGDTGSESRRQSLREADALVQGAARWLIAALGGIGAVLVAGSQLSSIGSLPLGGRFLLAVLGLGLGLVSVLWAIWRVVDLLAPERYTISELAQEWAASGAVRGEGVPGRAGRRRHPVADWLARNPEYLAGHESPGQLLQHWQDRTAPDRQRALARINDLVRLANHRRARERFDRTRVPLALAVLLAALGICLFAWAANPGELRPPSLRNADLSGADLSGTSLVGADLTGADLSGADLRGANLRDAVLDDVVWRGTTCPDGTNSDDTADAGQPAGQSCAGHLVP